MSPHKLLNVSSIPSPVLAKAAATLQSATVFRFDGSDLMPAEVGAGTFWSGVVDWIGGASTSTVTAAIEASWPAP